MNNLKGKWATSHLRTTGILLLTAVVTACGTADPVGSSSSSTVASVSSSSAIVQSSSSSSSAMNHEAMSLSEHCIMGFDAHATDGSLPDQPAEYVENGQTDVTLRPEIINWMSKNQWQEAHFLWHGNRRCGGFSFGGGGAIDPCKFPEMKPDQNECSGPQDGYEFLVMHRHMIHTLKQLWPSLQDQFNGWDRFPSRENYPEVVRQHYTQWNGQVQQAANLADNIDQMSRAEVLAQWPSEGAFGQWIQCGDIQGGALNSLHGALHFNGYPTRNQTHSIANQRTNLDAYLFWKLHGWIDNVWEKYRLKVGKPADASDLEPELIKQCQEHHFWAEQLDPSLAH